MTTASPTPLSSLEEEPFPFLTPTSCMDHYQTPLHACSVEATPHPLKVASSTSTSTNSSSTVWPVAISCYQLQPDGSRRGHMDVFLVQTPEIDAPPQDEQDAVLTRLKFGTPYSIHKESAGILDGKWHPSVDRKNSLYYATALSSGHVSVDRFDFGDDDDDDDDVASAAATEDEEFQKQNGLPSPPFRVTTVGKTDDASDDQEKSHLCLSLNWDNTSHTHDDDDDDSNNTASRIVSTYSDGKIAIHDVAFTESSVQLLPRDSWTAHTSFVGDTAAEVWCACFVDDKNSPNSGNNTNLILSGGDDSKMKLWDLRSTTRPSQVVQPFDAGVTVVSCDPRREYFVACGSYDETVALYDVRYASRRPMARSSPLGGGIWRIQWHPHEDQRLLLACMHGGCRVVNVDMLNDDEVFTTTRKFTQHDSMAYGAAWLVCRHPVPKREEYYEAAVSCSFYDKAAFLWRPVRSNAAEI